MTQAVAKNANQQGLVIQRLTESDFGRLAEAWGLLLENSEADPLFMSWPWLYSWWEVWGERLGLELALFGVYLDGDRLVGLAPFYRHEFRSPVGLRLHRLHIIGNAWRIQGTVRTEYSGVISEKGLESSVTQLVLSEVSRLSWDEFVVCDQSFPELLRWQEIFDQSAIRVRSVPRMVDVGVRVCVGGEFDQWLKELGPNTRLKVYNRRRYLAQWGTLQLRQVDASQAAVFLEQLNGFHRRRWGKPCFDQQAVVFHQKLISRLAEGQLALTALEYSGETVSVLYDIRAGQCRYNLQAGYVEDLDPKVALGTLHLGYAIEDSFRDPGITHYDLLAGYGKNSFYKTHFRGEAVDFVTIQFARNPVMRGIYWLQSGLPTGMRKSINRLVRL